MNPVALVVGAGVATGGAIARRFARAGYTACVARRNEEKLNHLVGEIVAEGGTAHAFGVDSTQEDQMVEMVARIEREIGPVEVAVYNAAIGTHSPIASHSAADYERVWRVNAFGAFLMGREVAKFMEPREKGTIIFTGATSALRGKANLAAFSGSKHALRALAQSMGRELFPKNIHVAHVIIDGPIDTPLIRKMMPKVFEERPADGVLAPEAIADAYYALHVQHRSAWSHETELRPWKEPW
ncbi:SDR family NAD(P)-dependent oxidoreductase [Iodidimonas sp. SYSU 1G8]|uniref:SDR family NAD(P)-dependent oxidoreductase n=1 Tax=Iodidimonas sp. SYSU 1G8 TaxID=3133967 RepID=UPI0031FF122B